MKENKDIEELEKKVNQLQEGPMKDAIVKELERKKNIVKK